MNIGIETILNMVPGGVMPIVYVNQYDAGYQRRFRLYNGANPFNIASNQSVTIRGTKGDGHGIVNSAQSTVGSNVVTVTITEQMTAVKGAKNIYELRVVDNNGLVVGTANFIMAVERAALDDDTIISDSDLSYADDVYNRLQSVEAYKNQLDNVDAQLQGDPYQMPYIKGDDSGLAWQYLIITPEMFGAKGDGVTDDTAALATACGVANRTVVLSNNYVISSEIRIAKNVSIVGGRNSSIIFAGNEASIKVNRYNTLEGFSVKIPIVFTNSVFEVSNQTLDDPDLNTNNTGILINNIAITNVSIPSASNRGTGCIFDIHMDQDASNYYGFWDVTISNIRFIGGIKYFCKDYIEQGTNKRWITDIRFNRIVIDSCDYGFFGAKSENDKSNYKDVGGLILDDISMQWNTSTLFAYFTSGSKTMKMINIWDRSSANIPVSISQTALSDSMIRIDAIPESPYLFFEVEGLIEVMSHYFVDKLVHFDITTFRGVRNVKNILEYNNYFRFLSKSASGSNLYFKAEFAMEKRATYAIQLTFFDDNGQHNVTIRPYWWNTWNCKYICDTNFMDNKTLYCKVNEDVMPDYNSCTLILKFASYPSNLIFYRSLSKGKFDSDVVFDEVSGTPDLTGYVTAQAVT